MATGCFVRTLWGDSLIDVREDHVREVSLCRKFPLQPEPTLFVAFGRENERIARSAGWETVLASEQPVVNLSGTEDRAAEDAFGMFPWGVNMYAHKFLAMRAALEQGWDAVVLLDMEIEMARPLPGDFWERLAAGQPVQAPLYHYVVKKCSWRKVGMRQIPGAVTLYCREAAILDKCLRTMAENPKETEEVALARLTDEMQGGWQGADGYKASGFQFPFCAKFGGMLFEPEEAVFGLHRLKGWSRWKKKGREAWREHVAKMGGG